MVSLSVPAVDVLYNTKAKIYLDGSQKITYCSKPIFKADGWETTKAQETVPKPKNMDNEVRPDSVKRAKEQVFDIALTNPFTHFITWTLDKEKIDRYDPAIVSKKLRKFLNNMQQRCNLMYEIIPETHKDGAIHMHGLVSGDYRLIDSGKKTKDGKVIYNMPQWSLGFSTAIELTGDSMNVAKYITKYVSKDFRKIFGSFYYAGGKGLQRKPSIQLYDTNYFEVNAKEYSVPAANMGFKYAVVEGCADAVVSIDRRIPDRTPDTGAFGLHDASLQVQSCSVHESYGDSVCLGAELCASEKLLRCADLSEAVECDRADLFQGNTRLSDVVLPRGIHGYQFAGQVPLAQGSAARDRCSDRCGDNAVAVLLRYNVISRPPEPMHGAADA